MFSRLLCGAAAVLQLFFLSTASASAVKLNANNLTFDCNVTGPPFGVPIMLLHGFPNRASWWEPLTSFWLTQQLPFRAVACDLRGYSPQASPDGPEHYTYDILATDVLSLADAVGWNSFHLAGHDHGSGLGWFVAAKAPSGRVLSYAALSVPHPDAFSRGMYGPMQDEAQVVASNYFNQFALPDSASRNGEALSKVLGYGHFQSAAQLQKALYWYNGSVGLSWARPAVVSDVLVAKYNEPFVAAVRKAIPLPDRDGAPATAPVGNVSLPTLFVCGSIDPYLLCTHPYAKASKDFVTGAPYEYFSAKCGHNVVFSGGSGGCVSSAEQQSVLEKITKFINGTVPQSPL